MKLEKLVNSSQALKELMQIDLEAAISFELIKLVKEIDEELKIFDITRKKALDKYGENKGQQIIVKKENIPIFNKEMGDLLNKDIKLKSKFILKKADLMNSKIKPSVLLSLEWLIK